MEWKTIDSAPRDGTWLLLYWPHWFHTPVTGYYDTRGWGGGNVGWYSDRMTHADGVEPTHWMPLPPPPLTKDQPHE